MNDQTAGSLDPCAWAQSWAAALVESPLLATTPIRCNEVNQVFRLSFADEIRYLKLGPILRREYDRLHWLAGKLPAPRPIAFLSRNDIDALLMTAIEGKDLAELSPSLPAQAVVILLARTLRRIHTTPITDWPFPATGSTLVHGDACLPNFLFHDNQLTGCIDLGDLALATPEVDLTAAVWSLQYNLGHGHGAAFLHEYGLPHTDETEVERLRLLYEQNDRENATVIC